MSAKSSPFTAHPRGTLVDLYIQPRAGRSEVSGIHDGTLRVRIAAPPVDGAANEELIGFLSKQLGVRKSDIEIVSGVRGRRKRVLVVGTEPNVVRDRLLP